jgi:ribosomal-protein-alanine N-acetyltransferase
VQWFDAQREPTPRPHFLGPWLQHQAGTVLALVDGEGACHGFGRIRPCLLRRGEGWRIGPLLADTPAGARRLLCGLLRRHRGVVLIDAPEANGSAAPLLRSLDFEVVSSTLRMVRGTPPAVPLNDVYGLACLELG